MRSCSPSKYSVSTVSLVRQTIRLGGNINPHLSHRPNASATNSYKPRDAANSEDLSSFGPLSGALQGERLIYRHEDRMPDLALDVLRQMSLASDVLDQDHLADTDHSALTVAGGYLHPGVEIDDVLPARCRVPVDVVLSWARER
jgi:hypothetical protein